MLLINKLYPLKCLGYGDRDNNPYYVQLFISHVRDTFSVIIIFLGHRLATKVFCFFFMGKLLAIHRGIIG